MGTENDYYRILGVLDDAEDIVIRAAYRALAQRYHPDKWQGDQAEATRRMAEINAAYAVLSDPAKRAAYDSTRDKNQFRDEPPDAEDANEAINRDWELATKYLPDLKRIEQELHKLSRELAFTFRLTLLESKRFSESQGIAGVLEKNFLSKYFGDQPEVQAFAKKLIIEGRKDAAKELNELVRVLGEVSYATIERVAKEFQTTPPEKTSASAQCAVNGCPELGMCWLRGRTVCSSCYAAYAPKFSSFLEVKNQMYESKLFKRMGN